MDHTLCVQISAGGRLFRQGEHAGLHERECMFFVRCAYTAGAAVPSLIPLAAGVCIETVDEDRGYHAELGPNAFVGTWPSPCARRDATAPDHHCACVQARITQAQMERVHPP